MRKFLAVVSCCAAASMASASYASAASHADADSKPRTDAAYVSQSAGTPGASGAGSASKDTVENPSAVPQMLKMPDPGSDPQSQNSNPAAAQDQNGASDLQGQSSPAQQDATNAAGASQNQQNQTETKKSPAKRAAVTAAAHNTVAVNFNDLAKQSQDAMNTALTDLSKFPQIIAGTLAESSSSSGFYARDVLNPVDTWRLYGLAAVLAALGIMTLSGFFAALSRAAQAVLIYARRLAFRDREIER